MRTRVISSAFLAVGLILVSSWRTDSFAQESAWWTDSVALESDGAQLAVENGDVNGDLARDLSDAVSLLGHLFLGGLAPVELRSCGTEPPLTRNGDANGDGALDVSDPIYLLGWLFIGGPPPVPACSLLKSASDDDDIDDSADDPEGDTFGVGPVQHDIREFSVESTSTDLVLTVELQDDFSTNPQDPNFIIMVVGVDTDQDRDTGASPDTLAQIFCPDAFPLGEDFEIAFAPVGPQQAAVQIFDRRGGGPPGPPMFVGTAVADDDSLTLTVPLASLGGDDGRVDAHVIVGTLPEPTDCAPDGAFVTSDVDDDDDDDDD